MPPSAIPDVILVGGGVMSAHVGTLLKSLDPRLSIHVLEAAGELARESSDGWNNAGTGHAGLCELNYTPPSAAPTPPPYLLNATLWAAGGPPPPRARQ